MDLLGQLQPNKRICFLGDSITAHGNWINEIAEFLLENHSDKKVLPFNCGVPGDSADNALNRIYCDCGCLFPDFVVVMFGMNDIGRNLYDGRVKSAENCAKRVLRLENYQRSLEKILHIFKDLNIQVILCTPTPYDIWQKSGTENLVECNEGLSKCRDIVMLLAKENHLAVIDFYMELTTYISENPLNVIINEDRVHPNLYGHHLMAQIFLKVLNLTDKINGDLPRLSNKMNRARFETEQILRKISFVDWCLNYDIFDDWNTANVKISTKLDMAKSWKDSYVDIVVDEYLKHKNNQDRLRNKLIQQTLEMYLLD